MDRSKARALRAGAAVLALSALAGCGGGGGGGGTTPTGSGMSFPLQAGYKALIINGYNVTFDVSGDPANVRVRPDCWSTMLTPLPRSTRPEAPSTMDLLRQQYDYTDLKDMGLLD